MCTCKEGVPVLLLADYTNTAHSIYMATNQLITTTTQYRAEDLIEVMDDPTPEDKLLVKKAFEFARTAHKDHTRNSGEPYFVHLYETAKSLAELDMDAATISAGLLHDSIEDVGITAETVEREFGKEVLFLVEGVTKLGELKFRGALRHIESLRRLFVATSKDIRVLMIKLMDRRHNMQTLDHVPPEKRLRIATETLSIYAPLANRLGMGEIKRDLEDLSFKYVHPTEYEEMSAIMQENIRAREPHLIKVREALKAGLVQYHVQGFRVESRVKGLYSLYKKLQRKGGDADKIYDILAIRIILGSVEDCYRALGVVHTLWHPLPGKIKDYIAFPKPNGYRSIHTTVVTKEAGPVEVQLRTEKIHQEAQYGVASHLSYKEARNPGNRGEQKKNRLWYMQLIPSLLRTSPAKKDITHNPPKWVDDLAHAHNVETHALNETFIRELQDDFFSHRIFVFTPKGDVVDLPIDSSPLDFAYSIHSEIGDHTSGAKVNGKLVALNTLLRNGDIVEIETKQNAHPNKKWVDYIKTTIARKHIQQYFAKQFREKDTTNDR
jgi:GTP diphosphokinase / guanosine-3',5'-bis(diphosphate) 3'-diphosphatase